MALKATKYSRKFLAEHEADLELYWVAQAEMRSLLGGTKLPKMNVLKEEGRKLTAKKKQLYTQHFAITYIFALQKTAKLYGKMCRN